MKKSVKMFIALLFCGFFCKFCGHQILIRRTFFQFSGAFQDILKQFKARFLKNQIRFPCVLPVISCHNGSDGFQIRFRELRFNTFCNLFRRVVLHIVHAFLQSVCKALDGIRMFFDEAFFGTEGRVGHVSAVFPERSNNMALALGFQSSCTGFEFNGNLWGDTPMELSHGYQENLPP